MKPTRRRIKLGFCLIASIVVLLFIERTSRAINEPPGGGGGGGGGGDCRPSISYSDPSRTACQGQSLGFGVNAFGAPLWYQWKKGDNILTNGPTGNGSTYDSVDSYVLWINNVAPADEVSPINGFHCVVSNSCGTITSPTVGLTVIGPPQPANQTGCIGQSASFSVTAYGQPPFTYRWRKDGTNLVNGATVSGATNAKLILNGITAADDNSWYDVVVSNICGSGISSAATLNINSTPPPSSTITPSVAYLGSTTNTASVPTSQSTSYSYSSNRSVASGVSQGSGSDNNLYGIDNDVLFKISPDGSTVTPLFQFSISIISNGYEASIPVVGRDGDLYGVTKLGGNTVANTNGFGELCKPGYGTVYRISTNSGSFTTLHVFDGTPEGAFPVGQLVQGADGSFYGVTQAGGVSDCPDVFCCATGYGTVYGISGSNGTLTTLHRFTGGADGAKPMAGLVQGSGGYLYGTTPKGGANDLGIVFKVSTNGDNDLYQILHTFAGGSGDGATPDAALVQGGDGNLDGTTTGGGANNLGTVFKVSTNGDNELYQILHAFTGGSDGADPPAALVQGNDGSFYSTTYLEGLGYGTIFRITPQGTLTTLYEFTGGADGANPDYGGLVLGSDGYWYGATINGGSNGSGTVYRFLQATYTWSITNGMIMAGQGSPTISFAVNSPCAVTLSVTASNDFSCPGSGSASVTVNSPQPTSNNPSTGETLTLYAPSVPNTTYSWTGPNGFTSTDQNPSITYAQQCDSGQYCLAVIGNGCTTTPTCVSVTVNPPQPTSNSPRCVGQTLDLYAPAVTNATYSWTGPNGFTSTEQEPTILGVDTNASGDYCLQMTISGCTSDTGCLSVTVNPLPTATVSGSSTLRLGCSATIEADLTGTPPWILTWSYGIITTNMSTPALYVVSPSSTTTYTVTALSDSNNCAGTSLSGSAIVTVTTNTTSSVIVSNEVLILYNTNVADSWTCADYYTNNRPGFADANVLGVSCTTTGTDGFETITTPNLTNEIINPIITFIQSHPDIHYVVLMYGMPSRVNDNPDGWGQGGHSVQFFVSRCLSDAGYTSGPYYEGSTCPFVPGNFRGTTCLVTALNMETLADCEAYIDKLTSMYRGDVIISAKAAGYASDNYYLEDVNNRGYLPALSQFPGVILSENPSAYVTYTTNSLITFGTNVTGYASWGIHNGVFGSYYATTGTVHVVWAGNSGWWIVATVESFNGRRDSVFGPGGEEHQGDVEQWFAPNAWGGTNYSNTPVGAVSHVEEPGSLENGPTYMSLWEEGFLFSECAWASKYLNATYLQVIGDPLIKQ